MRYYIRQQKTHVSGPYGVEEIQAWIREGRIRSDAEFSVDRKEWIWGIEIEELFPGDLKNEPRRRGRPAGRRVTPGRNPRVE